MSDEGNPSRLSGEGSVGTGKESNAEMPATALEEMEERIVKKILSRVASDEAGEAPSQRRSGGGE